MHINQDKAKATVSEIFALYEKHGDDDYIGEPVSQLEHMSQAAALAANETNDEELILAAFFHDIGHLCADESVVNMDGMGKLDHEQLGANYLLTRGFSERLVALVQGHVIGKRYLTYKFPEYYEQLSPASKVTLNFQGGVMTEAEAKTFELNPDAELIVRLRYWDDMAKETNLPVNNVAQLKEIALKHLLRNHRMSC